MQATDDGQAEGSGRRSTWSTPVVAGARETRYPKSKAELRESLRIPKKHLVNGQHLNTSWE